ncbi:phosphate ABC transporter substrate-binding/OmpA family protein [Jannaschia aquimarina]|uniref:OprF_2 protein n=1 Tax=Jannaschia aquimarina TaxID=935700 RepID=A0A0D1EGY8_9RHOB|nr:phosphate ABC transporter substrate-binding/OmpA family protein [Jannaschia aquimarina]KIT16904.1 Outer membrane porin F precursor [Jannaschia aquimarina]SNT11916.1 phosphate transport system substrate-binding protein [Jannaschia aquimarina]
MSIGITPRGPRRIALLSFTALVFVGSAVAEQVSLRSGDGEIAVDGELISFEDDTYIVRVPNLGDLRLGAGGLTCYGPGCPETAFELGGQVTLTAKTGGETFSGRLVDIADGMFSVESGGVILSAAVDTVTCSGPGCPPPAVLASSTVEDTVEAEEVAEAPPPVRLPADLVMVGSDNVGEDLMPLVMEPFAEILNATVLEPIEFPDAIAQYIFTPNDGGDPFVIEVESNDSEIGFDRLVEGTADIAMASGPPDQYQVAALKAQGRGDLFDPSQEYIIGVDSVLMTVHTSNPIESLSRQQLISIYTDRTTNWAEVGGPNLSIMPGARDGGSARRNFENWAFGGKRDLSPRTTELDRGRDMRAFVEENPGAIGYSISDNVGDTRTIDLILDCGVVTEATPFKSKAEEYLLGRRIRLYIDNQNPKPEVQQLVDYMISPAADQYVAESGYFSLGIVEDDRALARLINAARIGQPGPVVRDVQDQISAQLSGANRLSMTFRFPTDEFRLDSKGRRDLDRLVEFMGRPENAGRELIFVGFADTVGQFAYNTQLSRNRAEQVLNELRWHPDAGTLRDMRMSAVGLSEAAPMSCNDNPYGRSRNRRVEVWVR